MSAAGDLIIHTPAGEMRQRKPVVYQETQDGRRREVASGYALKDNSRVSFTLGKYDASRTLIIDPVLVYSTYLGGNGSQDVANAIAVDSAGNGYVTGYTTSPGFPTTAGAFDTTFNGDPSRTDAFVTKFNATGTGLIYSTYLGGSGGPANDAFVREEGIGIAVDSAGNAYITGSANSASFPTTPGAFDTTYNFGNADAFVTKLDATGSNLVYSTFLGGSGNSSAHGDQGMGIAVDSAGNAYVIGDTSGTNLGGSPPTFSTDFPTTPGAFDTTMSDSNPRGREIFVAKLNASGSNLVYSTLLNGTEAKAIAIDSDGNAYVTGIDSTPSGAVSPFPTTSGAFDENYNSGGNSGPDTFVTKFNATGSSLVYSTFLGGDGSDRSGGIAVDSSGNAYVTGYTVGFLTNGTLTHNFPTTPGAFDTSNNDTDPNTDGEAFVTKLDTIGHSLVYSTYLGGNKSDVSSGIAIDSARNAYVTGVTRSLDFPTTSEAFDKTNSSTGDAFMTKLNPTGSGLVYSTLLGGSGGLQGATTGIAVDSAGNAYVTGYTVATNFPTTPGAFDTTKSDAFFDAFVFKIGEPLPVIQILSTEKLLNGHFLLQGVGVASTTNSVEATDSLALPFGKIGEAIADNNGHFQFEDVNAPGFTNRFYRIVYP